MRTIESPRLRRLLRVLLPALVIPALVLGGALMLDEKRQMFTAFAVAVWILLVKTCLNSSGEPAYLYRSFAVAPEPDESVSPSSRTK